MQDQVDVVLVIKPVLKHNRVELLVTFRTHGLEHSIDSSAFAFCDVGQLARQIPLNSKQSDVAKRNLLHVDHSTFQMPLRSMKMQFKYQKEYQKERSIFFNQKAGHQLVTVANSNHKVNLFCSNKACGYTVAVSACSHSVTFCAHGTPISLLIPSL